MKWKGRRESTNVVDSRGKKIAGTAGAGMLLNFVGRRFGMKGILIMIAVVGVLWMTGVVDPAMFLGGSTSQSGPYQASPAEQERFDFVKVVLADTEDVWTAEFARHGESYAVPQLEIYNGRINTACGAGAAQMGPFYCPGDRKVYIDLVFTTNWKERSRHRAILPRPMSSPMKWDTTYRPCWAPRRKSMPCRAARITTNIL